MSIFFNLYNANICLTNIFGQIYIKSQLHEGLIVVCSLLFIAELLFSSRTQHEIQCKQS